MVRGLEDFRDWFSPFRDHYALIGGSACDILLEEAGFSFRATKDLDVVVLVDAVEPEFARLFWEYVHRGGYVRKAKSSGKPRAYRFEEPSDAAVPHMIELFARIPEMFETENVQTDTVPLPVDDPEVSSLSAIILDDEYFSFLRTGVTEREGVPIVGASHLIVLKALAWSNLREKKAAGERIDAYQIKKHRNDIFRLFPVLNPGQKISVSKQIRDDMERSLTLLREESIAMAEMGIRTMTQEAVIEELEKIYVHGS